MKWVFLTAALFVSFSGVRGDELVNGGDFSPETTGTSGDQALDLQHWKLFSSAPPMLLQMAEDPLGSSKHALRMQSHAVASSYEGVFEEVPVQGGKAYTLTARVLNDKASPLKAGSIGLLSVEWIDASGHEIAREDGTAWDSTLSATSWQPAHMTSSSPAGAVKAHLVIMQKDLATDTPGGAFYITDFSAHEQ